MNNNNGLIIIIILYKIKYNGLNIIGFKPINILNKVHHFIIIGHYMAHTINNIYKYNKTITTLSQSPINIK